jgi:hypothetical protein
MSHLLDKSEQNKKTALYLITDSPQLCYPASVHCCYYSCLQKIIHLFEEYYDLSQTEVKERVRGGKGGSHGYYIKEIGGLLLKSDKRDAFNIRNDLEQLRELRIKADYEDEKITEDMARQAFIYADTVHKILKKHFQL